MWEEYVEFALEMVVVGTGVVIAEGTLGHSRLT
jgi:hypothetical protein